MRKQTEYQNLTPVAEPVEDAVIRFRRHYKWTNLGGPAPDWLSPGEPDERPLPTDDLKVFFMDGSGDSVNLPTIHYCGTITWDEARALRDELDEVIKGREAECEAKD